METEAEMETKYKRPKVYQRQDSWTEIKGRLFKVASTVVLPRNRRISASNRCTAGDVLKTPTMSVKSLPQMQIKRDFIPMPKIYNRSISEQNAHSTEQFVPEPAFRVPVQKTRGFVPRRLLEKVEEVESPCGSSSRSSSEDGDQENLSDKEDHHGLAQSSLGWQQDLSEEGPMENQFPIPAGLMSRNLPPSAGGRQRITLGENTKPKHRQLQRLIPQEDEHPETKDEEYFEEDEDSLNYHDFYNCMPPPVFMLCITVAEIAFFAYHAKRLVNDPKYGYISKFSPAPLDSRLIYDPTRRYEVWRYITYALVHSGYMHLINNIVIQLVLGILLEMVHKWWRVLTIYFAGILAGSLATSISEPFNYLAGASAGVYALIAAHLSTVILNWTEMEHPWIRVLIFFAFVLHDGGTALYYVYYMGETTNVGYAAHLGGAVAGLLVGIHVLKNLQWRKWEEVLWWVCLVLYALLLLFAIAWNIFRSDLYP